MAYVVSDEFESQRVALSILATYSFVQPSYYLPLFSWLQLPVLSGILGGLWLYPFHSLKDLQTWLIMNPGGLLVIGRILSALISAAAVLWVYRIGTLLANRKTGLVAGLLFSLSFLRVQLAHFARPTSLYLFCALAFLYYLLRFQRHQRVKPLAIAILWATAATLSYPLGIVLYGVIGVSLICQPRSWKPIGLNRWVWGVIGLSFVAVFGAILLTPGVLANYLPQIQTSSSQINLLERFNFYISSFIHLEPAILGLGLLGIGFIPKKRWRFWVTTGLFSLSSWLPYLVKDTYESRYLLTLILGLIFPAANALMRLNSRWLVGVLILITGYQLGVTGMNIYQFWQPSTYSQMQSWIESNLPADRPILMSRDNLNIVPNLTALAVVNAKKPAYHQAQRQVITSSNVQWPQVKQIYYEEDISQLLTDDQQNNLVFEYIIISSLEPIASNYLTLWGLNPNQYYPRYTLSPSLTAHRAVSPLEIDQPWDLRSLQTIGPYWQVFEKISHPDQSAPAQPSIDNGQ